MSTNTCTRFVGTRDNYIRNTNFIFKGVYDFHGFSIQNSDINEDTQVIFLVQSKWNDAKNRDYIRQSFGRINSLFLSLTYQTIFLFNLPEDTSVLIESEAKNNKDLLIPNIKLNSDGLMVLSAFQWLTKMESNIQYIVKIDTNTMVNLDKLDEYLYDIFNENPIRCRKNGENCIGPFFILSLKSAEKLFRTYEETFLIDNSRIENDFITGIKSLFSVQPNKFIVFQVN